MLRELTKGQLAIMKCIWDADGEICYQELMARMKQQFGKEYKRSTVVTFLQQLSDKRYVDTYRIGKRAYARPIVTEEQFQQEHAREEVDHWYNGRVSDFLQAYIGSKLLSGEEISRIRELLDRQEKERSNEDE